MNKKNPLETKKDGKLAMLIAAVLTEADTKKIVREVAFKMIESNRLISGVEAAKLAQVAVTATLIGIVDLADEEKAK